MTITRGPVVIRIYKVDLQLIPILFTITEVKFTPVTRSPKMAEQLPSRAPATLAGVLDAIAAHGALTDWLRRDLSWAIRTLCHALGQPASNLPADPAGLTRRMDELTTAAAGVSRGAWRNVETCATKA